MKVEDISFQLVSPYYHCTNPAEKAIWTFKYHLISGLASADPAFPLHLWDRFIIQFVLPLTSSTPYKSNRDSL